MAVASLGLKIKDNNDEESIITLETGTLRYIDSIISDFADAESLKKDKEFLSKLSNLSPDEIQKSKVVLTYIRNNNEKLQLQPIYNDQTPICTRSNSVEDIKSEVEKARKLLFSSRNQLFLLMFLNRNVLLGTTSPTVKMTFDEYKKAKETGLPVLIKDGEYRLSIKDILTYKLSSPKLGPMRLLFEDTLEVWKKSMLDLPDEDLYFYSRELRILINEYNYRKIPRRAVYNLKLNNQKLNNLGISIINRYRHTTCVNTKGLIKKLVD